MSTTSAILVGLCLLCAGFFLYRNHWVFLERTSRIGKDEYDKLPTYDYMFWHFWIWDVNKFIRTPSSGIYIVSAAVKDPKTDHIIMSIRHYDETFYKVLEGLLPPGVDVDTFAQRYTDQGFITNKKQFVDRKEAWLIAKSAGQIRKIGSNTGTLYSENLY